MSNRPTFQIPDTPFPLLPLRSGVLLPGTTLTLPVGRQRSLALLGDVAEGDTIGVGVQRDAKITDPSIADLFPIGTLARVRARARVGPRRVQLVLEGLGRFSLDQLVSTTPYWKASGRAVEEVVSDAREARALAELLRDKIIAHAKSFGEEIAQALATTDVGEHPGLIGDQIAAALDLSMEQEPLVLLELDVITRLRLVHRLLSEAEAMAEIKQRVAREVKGELDKSQREALLRQQLRAIQRELGEDDEDGELAKLRRRLDEAGLSEEARKVVDRELKRIESMAAGQPEYQVIRNYLELIADLPWDARAEVADDIDKVAEQLDADHHGLENVKTRILEHLAVRRVADDARGAILCLVGPPGVGKTSLGQSIADATGRPFVRVALGGVRDEAEIRGHRRTYIGALPGRIISALRRVEVKNPLVLLDEVDKLSAGWRGAPESALLEALDPEQNNSFTDHYLELPFDLSEVLFLCTANTLETLSPPLRDRLEVIELEGYTVDEKLAIARRHLLPKTMERHGLGEDALRIDDQALAALVRDYTREAGVRQLTRELTKICRAVTLELARNPDAKQQPVAITAERLGDYVGKPRFFDESAERTSIPGVATGLAWTPVGGDILFIETSRMPGKGRLEITGQLGDVMKESARAALSYIKSRAGELGIDPEPLERQDLHIHVPAGAIPKDGPSAGVTMFTALASLLSGRRVRGDTAMTGECTLRGRVLPVGGIKAKVLAAHRSGITRVILPSKNRRDLDDVPESVREALEVLFADNMGEVLDAALEPGAPLPEVLPPATEAPCTPAPA